MELQFAKKVCPCLRRNVREVQNQEVTQEVKLPDGLPDIGNILAAWGQCILRSKEWRSDGMSVSGGVMAWILYDPADGTEPRSIEAWLPVQMRWPFSENEREGSICTSWLLRGVDARTLSARKMMVRANVGVLGEALEPWEAEMYTPEDVPEDVQLLRRVYPAMIPREAGEKTFLLDEELMLPSGSPVPEKIIYCEMTPVLSEQKVLGGKAVFRGNGLMHLLYSGVDGQLHSADVETGFSQFSDLDRDYDKEATISTMMAVSSLEPELQDGRVRVKCGLVAQYVICDRMMLETVEDAYSPNRSVQVETDILKIPMVLDTNRETLRAEATVPVQASSVVDVSSNYEHPVVRRAGDLTELEMPGTFQVLYYDEDGKLQGTTAKWNSFWELPTGEGAELSGMVQPMARPQAVIGGGQIDLRTEMQVEAAATAREGMSVVSALDLGDTVPADPARPSLILRRAGEDSLWELAKTSGSTVDAIRMANKLTDEPQDDRILLIPVS